MTYPVYFTSKSITNDEFMTMISNAPGNNSGSMNVSINNDENPILNFGDFTVSLFVDRSTSTNRIYMSPLDAKKQFTLYIPPILQTTTEIPLNIPSVAMSNVLFAYGDFDNDGDLDLAIKAQGMKGALLFTQQQELRPDLHP